jgi:diketogulonate reductase-like aldo/keto reductase
MDNTQLPMLDPLDYYTDYSHRRVLARVRSLENTLHRIIDNDHKLSDAGKETFRSVFHLTSVSALVIWESLRKVPAYLINDGHKWQKINESDRAFNILFQKIVEDRTGVFNHSPRKNGKISPIVKFFQGIMLKKLSKKNCIWVTGLEYGLGDLSKHLKQIDPDIYVFYYKTPSGNLLMKIIKFFSTMLNFSDGDRQIGIAPSIAKRENLDTIVEFIRSGKVRFGGVSQLNPNLLKSIRGNQAVSCLQYCLNFFENKTINAIDAQIEHEQYGLVTYSPFASGWIFNKKYRELANSTYPFFKKGYYRSEFPLYSRLFQLAEKSNVSLKSMALNWIMRNEKVNTILVGASTQQQVEENAMVNVYSMQSDLFTKIDNLVAKYSPQKRFVRSFMWRIGVGLARGKIRMINQKVK